MIKEEYENAAIRLYRPYFASTAVQNAYYSINGKDNSIDKDSNLIEQLIHEHFKLVEKYKKFEALSNLSGRELVNKNIPKKPIRHDYIVRSFIFIRHKSIYTCPRCGNSSLKYYTENGRNVNNYCYDCGQRLDWSDEND